MDADGDLTVSYEGFGPDVTDAASSAGDGTILMSSILSQPENADLVAAFPNLMFLSLPYGSAHTGDPDSVIEEVLIEAQKYHNFTDWQLGRLNAIMNQVIGLLRGEAYGVMYTQFDADPRAVANILAADNVVNTQRDGTNSRWTISIDKRVTTGSFQIRVTNGTTGRAEDLTVTPAYTQGQNPVIDPVPTQRAIEAALKTLIQELGINWPTAANSGDRANFDGPVKVRLMSDQEILDRQGTYWDLGSSVNTGEYVYEISLMGEVHNTEITIQPNPGNPQWNQLKIGQADAPPPVFVEMTSAFSGTDQHDSSIAMTPDGSYVIAWTQDTLDSTGFMSNQAIQYYYYHEANDTAGPTVANWFAADGSIIQDGGTIYDPSGLQHVVISFTEAMFDNATHTGDAVTNPANYALLLNGVKINGAIVGVQYGMNKAADLALLPGYADLNSTPTNHWEVILTIDANGTDPGTPQLKAGDYRLDALAPKLPTTADPTGHSGLRDRAGNALGHTGFFPNGATDSLNFSVIGSGGEGTDPGDPSGTNDPLVNTTRPRDQLTPDTAVDANGNYVVVWTTTNANGTTDIMGQLFNKSSQRSGKEFMVNSFTTGNQLDPAVAMDDAGNFIVVWSGQGQADESGVFGRMYDMDGVAVSDEFRINQTITSVQDEPAVAMDSDGDFVVSWTSYGQDGDLDGIYARRFTKQGTPKAGELLVNTTTKFRQDSSDVAMDGAGDFVVVWRSDQQDGNSWGIYGQRFSAAGGKLGGEFRANATTADDQIDPAVAMDADGDFVVAWSSMLQDGNGYGIYDRRFSAAGVAKDAADVRVNQTTIGWQITPDVGMDAKGDYVVTWSSFQDIPDPNNPTKDYGIYARLFNADGTNYRNSSGQALGEFRVNSLTLGNQITPAVSVSPSGRTVVAWAGPEEAVAGTDMGIFARVMKTSWEPASPTSGGPVIGRVAVNQAAGFMSWNTTDPDGVASSSITIDSTTYAGNGPWADLTSGVNFTRPITGLAAGVHNYTITALDKAGNSSQLKGSFTIGAAPQSSGPPVIAKMVVTEAVSGSDHDGVLEISDRVLVTWNVATSAGVASRSFKINGTSVVPAIGGPNATGDYYTSFGPLAAGTYTFTIDVTDTGGLANSQTGQFIVVGASATPIISHIVVTEAVSGSNHNGGLDTADRVLITWRTTSAAGIAGQSIAIDNKSVSSIGGPNTTADYYSAFGPLGAGKHSYTIKTTDNAGRSSNLTGTFQIVAALTVAADASPSAFAPSINGADLGSIVTEAISRLETAYGPGAAAALAGVSVEVTDLPGKLLGAEADGRILIDDDAAGYGWFVDPTPHQDEEFAQSVRGELTAAPGTAAVGRADLLTAVMHEMGHAIGFDHSDDGLMAGTLSLGVRSMPGEASALDQVFASLNGKDDADGWNWL